MKHLRQPFTFSMSDLNHIVVEELRRGKTQRNLIAYLQKRGWPLTAAEHFVRNAALAEANADPKIALPQHPPTSAASQPSWRAAIVWMLALMGLAVVLVDVIARNLPF